MALTNDQITAQNFKDFYGQIRPYLNGQVPTFANRFSRSDLYSTDEKIIGSFTDGKPIYQKTLLLSLSDFSGSGGVRYYDVRSLNIDTPISAKGYYNYNNSVKMTFPDIEVTGSGFNSSYSASVMLRNSDNANGLVLWLQDSALSAFKDCAITIQYTKKSDSAIKVGTGTDYSTDEQIIGTWIDGKPLYQKTLQMTMPTTTSQKDGAFFRGDTNLDVSAIGIAQLVELKAVHNSDVIINIGTYFGYTSDIEETQYEGMQVIMCWYNHSSNLIQLRRFSGKTVNSDAGATVYVTIQYTKTTDV